MKRLLALLAAAVALTPVVAAVAVAEKGPEEIDLPDGYRPEGIAAGKARNIFVGSIPTGQVLEIDTKTGERREAVPGRDDHAAIGLKYDKHANRLFVAGGPTGKAFVYDAGTGAELAAFQLTPGGNPTFINDVVLTRDTAYFTDSRQPVIYAVNRDLSGVTPIELDGFPMTANQNNLNGIAADPTGRFLLAIQSSTGDLWRIDPSDGSHERVDLGTEELTAGDGLLLIGQRTLLVVQNRLNQIAVVKLDRGLLSGEVTRTIEDPGTTADPAFDVPTTVAKKRGRLYLPNARFRPMGEPIPTEFWVTQVHAH
jgi:sugar lactone lactonase YvrE